MAIPLQEKTDELIDHIRKNTKDDGWVSIGVRDIPKILEISQIYATRILETVKEHPHILYEVDESFPTRYKPYHFRWVEDEQEKIKYGISAKQFFWLNEEEVEYVKGKANLDTYDKAAKILKICNLLVGDGAKEYWVPIKIDALADLLVATTKETHTYLRLLKSKQILVKADHHDLYRLVLDPNAILEVKQEAKRRDVRTKPKLERKKRRQGGFGATGVDAPVEHESATPKVEHHLIIIEPKSSIVPEAAPVEENASNENNNVYRIQNINVESLHSQQNIDHVSPTTPQSNTNLAVHVTTALENAEKMERTMEGMLAQLRRQISEIREMRSHEDDNKRSFEAFLKLSTEYEELMTKHSDTLEKLAKSEFDRERLEKQVKDLCAFNKAFIKHFQQRMIVMLGNISGYLDEYIVRPKYERTDEVINAELKHKIWKVVEGESIGIADWKPESKFAPDLK